MVHALLHLALFAAKALIVLFVIVVVLFALFALPLRLRPRKSGLLVIKNINEKFADTHEMMMDAVLPPKQFKQFLSDKKALAKKRENDASGTKNIYVLNFDGDVQASAVAALSEEITAVLLAAKPNDEVLVRLESGGGVVHGYGLGASQLMRIRGRNIPLTIAIDKVAASGGYMMACTANKIVAAPFAIIGSIGVVTVMPNFHKLLKDNRIDFEMQTSGEYKRTLTMFGENTDAGRKKMQEGIEQIHQQFKDLIQQHRPQINIAEVSTGEHWSAQQAMPMRLVDEIMTSDEYLLSRSREANIYEICWDERKPLISRMVASAKMLREKLLM